MCRFKIAAIIISIAYFAVSIHPMCRFKEAIKKHKEEEFIVSIHPMCRFKTADLKVTNIASKFQYILCVGSRKQHER